MDIRVVVFRALVLCAMQMGRKVLDSVVEELNKEEESTPSCRDSRRQRSSSTTEFCVLEGGRE